MRLRKIVLALTFSCFLFLCATAQNIDSVRLKPIDIGSSKVYYLMGIGYNFSAGIGSFRNYVESSSGSSTTQNINGSWGKGFDLVFALGKKMNKNLGIELELGYLIGGKNKEGNQYYVTSYAVPYIVKQDATYKANTFRFNPKIVIEIPFKNTNAFYCKIGYMLGVGKAKISTEEDVYFENGQQAKGSFEWERIGGVVSGSTTALGVRFKTSEDVSFFMELSGNSLHRKFTEQTLVKSIINNQNKLDETSVYEKELIFVDKSTTYLNVTPNPDQPRTSPAYRTSYSSVGFKVGFIKHF